MRIALGIGGEPLGVALAPAAVVARFEQAERDSFPSAWCTHFSRGIDALSVLAVAAGRTRRIALGVGVVPTYPRHPVALAQQAATVQALAGGRLTLGVGVSHRPAIEAMHGIPYERPAAHMRDYLAVLVPLLSEGHVNLDGELFQVHAEISVPETAPVSVIVGALSPLMARVAGEGCDGIVTWLAGPRTLERVLVPAVTETASRAGRRPPRIVAALPVAVADEAQARATADATFARYGTLANYQRLFEREGVSSPGQLAVVGDERAVERQLRRYAALGATELWPIAFPVGPVGPVGDDPGASLARTTQLLAALAPDLAP